MWSHVTPALQQPQPAPPCEGQRPGLSGRRTTPTPPVVLLETQALPKSCENDTYLFDTEFWLQPQLQAQHSGLPITNGVGHTGPGGSRQGHGAGFPPFYTSQALWAQDRAYSGPRVWNPEASRQISQDPQEAGQVGMTRPGGPCQAGVWPGGGIRVGAGPRWLWSGLADEWTEDPRGRGRQEAQALSPTPRHWHTVLSPHLLSPAPYLPECVLHLQGPSMARHGAHSQGPGLVTLPLCTLGARGAVALKGRGLCTTLHKGYSACTPKRLMRA